MHVCVHDYAPVLRCASMYQVKANTHTCTHIHTHIHAHTHTHTAMTADPVATREYYSLGIFKDEAVSGALGSLFLGGPPRRLEQEPPLDEQVCVFGLGVRRCGWVDACVFVCVWVGVCVWVWVWEPWQARAGAAIGRAGVWGVVGVGVGASAFACGCGWGCGSLGGWSGRNH